MLLRMLKIIKYIFVFVLINNLVLYSYAQNKKDTSIITKFIKVSELAKSEKDSLKMFLSANKAVKLSHKVNDDLYIAKSYFNLALCYYYYDLFKVSIKNYDKSIFYYNKINLTIDISNCYYNKANAYYHLNNLDSALHYHIISFELREKGEDKSLIAASTNAVGLSYWRKGNYNKAIKYYKKSLEIRKEIGDTKGVSMILNSLGAVYWGQGKYNTAHSYYLKALKIVDSLKLNRKFVLIKNNIGLIFQEWEQYDVALDNHLIAIERCKAMEYNNGLAYSEINAGICCQHLNKNIEALKYLKNALLHYESTERPIEISYANRIIGNFYLHTKNIEKAINHYNIAYKKSKETGSNNHKAYALKAIADAYIELGNYKLSERYSFMSLKISIKEDYKNLIKDNYYNLAKLNEQNNNIVQAYKYYKKASEIKDTISRQMLKNNILDLQEKYESEKKETENILLLKEQKINETDLKIRNNVIVISLISLIILIVFVFILILNRKKIKKTNKLLFDKNKKINFQKLELKKTNTELAKANNYRDKIISIIGHDIKAPVGTIKELLNLVIDGKIKGDELDEIIVMIRDKIAATDILIHDLFTWVKNQKAAIPFKPELIKIHLLISNIIKLLKGQAERKSIKIINNVKSSTAVYVDRKMLDIILRNLISNSIKFTQNNGKIVIEAFVNKDFVKISVKDNGIGIKKEVIKKILSKDEFYSTPGTNEEQGSGLGLQLCIDFLKTNKSELFIESEPEKGSTFTFNLPKISSSKK